MKLKGKRTVGMGIKSGSAVREYKSVGFELESADEKTGEFSGYASVFGNVDDGGDIVEKGAFAKTIVEDFSRIKILSQHDQCELPIGKPLELREDEKGLFIRGKISDTQKGRDIQTLLKDGVLNELSIGYDVVDYSIDESTNIRHLKQIKLWEVSIVTWAMNDQAMIDDVKSIDAVRSMAEELKAEAKSGKMSRARLNALKPFIGVVRELVEILSPFLELPPEPEKNPDPDPEPEPAPKKQKKSKSNEMVFEIIRN